MSQAPKAPTVMFRIEEKLAAKVRGLSADAAARLLLSEGWIDIEWAAEHTRDRSVVAEPQVTA